MLLRLQQQINRILLRYMVLLSNYNMDPRQKLKALQDQKSKLKARIDQINGQESKEMVEDKELQALLQKKRMVEEERRKQAQYGKLEKEYNERKRQMDREKELARLQNERRVLELQAAMKRVVVEGMKQKVKGMNSDQLMMRGFLRNGEQIPGATTNGQKSNGTFKEAFEGFLLQEGADKLKAKYDIKQLNEQRLAYFERKEETVMRGILLKELAASEDPTELDVMALNREQLEEELEQRGIDFEDYMHPVDKQMIVENYPMIEQTVKGRIGEKRREQEAEVEAGLTAERERRALREQVKGLPFKSVQVVQRMLYDLFDEICYDYEKRHVPLSEDDKALRARNLQQQYQQICQQGLVQQLAREVAEEMLQGMRQEMVRQAAEQVFRLHELAHTKTELCFKGLFGDNASERIANLDRFKLPLVFVSESQNQVGKPKQEKYMKNLDNENGIYQTEESTTNLVNDIVLLDAEERYLDKVNTQIKKQIDTKTEDTIFCYDRQLFAVTRNGVRSVVGGQVYYSFAPALEGMTGASKLHKNWLLQSQGQLTFVSPWGREDFGAQLGSRISNPCGSITCASFYPVATLLGTPTSVVLGFEKGQLLKFNFNRDRVSGRQTNLTHYLPVIQHAKSGDQPAFPLDNRNYLPIELDKPKPTHQIHEYREFLQHHAEPVIFVGFYRVDKLISVDRGLKCALWEYGKGRGVATYQPVFKFQIKSTYHTFTEDENPRYKDIYPTTSSSESPEEMYQKYMQTEAFLRLQLYNNPKKEIAYFKSPLWDSSEEEKPIWKITYKEGRGQVNKILESFYNVTEGSVVGQQGQLVGDTLHVLCEREHIIRNDLKTVKIYSWSITEKRLGRVGVEIDMFKDQRVSSFVVLPAQFRGADLDMVLVVNSGRMLLFSLVSGQLLKNINEEINTGGKQAALYFKAVVRATDQDALYGVSSTGVVELVWDDGNSVNERNRLNKAIDAAKRKYFR